MTIKNHTHNKINKLLVLIFLILGIGLSQSPKEYGLFYSVAYFESQQINPIYGNYYLEGVQVNELMYSRLWTWKKDISETSDLVDNITPSSFGKMIRTPSAGQSDFSWNVEIRPNLRWPDGAPLTSEDIKYSFGLYASDITQHSLKPWLKLIKRIEIKNSTTLRFYVDQKNLRIVQYILPLVQILPKHKIPTNYLPKNCDFTKNPMGSGPFQYNPTINVGENKYTFTRNRGYYKSSPHANISSVNLYVERVLSSVIGLITVEDRREDWGTLDLLISVPTSPINFEALYDKGKNHLTFETYSSNSWYAIAFNCEKPALANPEIRKALTLGVDIQQAINDRYTYVQVGGSEEAIAKRISGPFNPLWGIGDATLLPMPYNQKEAESILNNNNFMVKNNRRQFEGNPVKLKLIYNIGRVFQGSPEELVISDLIADLRRLKIDVQPKGLPASDFEQNLENGDYDLAFQYYELGYGSNIAPLFTERNKMNISNYSDPILSTYLEKFNHASGVQRSVIGRDIHKLIYAKSPYIFLYRLDKIMAYRKELITEGEIVPKYFFTHIGKWYFRD